MSWRTKSPPACYQSFGAVANFIFDPTMMASCFACNGAVPETSAFCHNCGTPVGRTEEACSDCGTCNARGTAFCHGCGRRIGAAVERSAVPMLSPPESAAPPEPESGARLVTVRRDGTDGDTFPVPGPQMDIGRTEGDLQFADPHLGPRHARLEAREGAWYLVPLERRNGVYVRLRGPMDLADGDQFLVGKQVLRFERVAEEERTIGPAMEHGVVLFGTPVKMAWGRLTQLTATGTCRDVYHLTRNDLVLGREQGDVVFSDDEFLSRKHAQLRLQDGRVTVQDLGSSNGTYFRVTGPFLIDHGEMIRMGDELLRFEIG